MWNFCVCHVNFKTCKNKKETSTSSAKLWAIYFTSDVFVRFRYASSFMWWTLLPTWACMCSIITFCSHLRFFETWQNCIGDHIYKDMYKHFYWVRVDNHSSQTASRSLWDSTSPNHSLLWTQFSGNHRNIIGNSSSYCILKGRVRCKRQSPAVAGGIWIKIWITGIIILCA